MSTGRGWVIAGALALLAAGPAFAFGTVRGLGQDAEHETITRQGLSGFGIGPRTMDEIAGKRGTFGAVGAPDRPDRGMMSYSEVHCDNGDWLDLPGYPQPREEARGRLGGCHHIAFVGTERGVEISGALVADTDDLAIDMTRASIAKGCRYNGKPGRTKCNVLENLGLSLHASQDFYSHSNWLDPLRRPGLRLDDPSGMGQASPIDWLDMDQPDLPVPDGLITGCYEGFPETRHCEGRVKHATLNKDGKGSPRGRDGVYGLAMDVAAEDTKARWDWFEKRLTAVYGSERGALIACVIKSDVPAKCRS